MGDRVITISENGAVNIPAAPIQMTVHEIAELLDVLVPTVKAKIKSVLKSKFVAKHYGLQSDRFNAPEFYDLEMIIAVAFAVDSYRANIFRRFIMRKATTQPAQPIFLAIKRDNIYN